ncbi:hypothetical protein HDU84_000326 [Entophlyctis sp. JEL0112]|nr:hypothetical protein HDU84_000326 [Entophlyctis sp. JEL0112]
MEEAERRLSNLETRFHRLSHDSLDSIQTITNWSLSRQHGKQEQSPDWGQQLKEWKNQDASTESLESMIAARSNVLQILALLRQIVADMHSTLRGLPNMDNMKPVAQAKLKS